MNRFTAIFPTVLRVISKWITQYDQLRKYKLGTKCNEKFYLISIWSPKGLFFIKYRSILSKINMIIWSSLFFSCWLRIDGICFGSSSNLGNLWNRQMSKRRTYKGIWNFTRLVKRIPKDKWLSSKENLVRSCEFD